jgi:hypothetical protein
MAKGKTYTYTLSITGNDTDVRNRVLSIIAVTVANA